MVSWRRLVVRATTTPTAFRHSCRYHSSVKVTDKVESQGAVPPAKASPPPALSLAFEELSPSSDSRVNFGCSGPGAPSVAEPCILLHGLLGCRRNLRNLGKLLLPFKTCILADLRNHGDSPHDSDCSFEAMTGDIYHLITETLRTPKVHIIGHSLGGRVAMATALTYPELVCGLGVLDMAPPRTKCDDPASASSHQHASRGELLRILKLIHNTPLHKFSTRTDAEKWLVENYDGNKPLSQATVQFLTQNLKIRDHKLSWSPNIPALLASFDQKLVEWPFEPDIHQWTNGPALFIRGTRSRWVEAEDFSTIRNFFPKAVIRDVEAGHWVHAETPNAVAQEIHRCWNQKRITN